MRRLLDLFCKAGGAGMGYHRAGFEVVGVDIEPQPHYPFEFHQADALEYLRAHWREFDAIHASPPCQKYSTLAHLSRDTHKALIPETRHALSVTGKLYIIENVSNARKHLISPIILCGSSFGLRTNSGAQLRRHRAFETNFNVGLVSPCSHFGETIGVFGSKARNTANEKRHYSKDKLTRGTPQGIKFTLRDAQSAMGIEWMNFPELSQAIPPAYTEWIGMHLRAALL